MYFVRIFIFIKSKIFFWLDDFEDKFYTSSLVLRFPIAVLLTFEIQINADD